MGGFEFFNGNNIRKVKNLFTILFVLISSMSWSQYLLPNEEIIFSFETKNGKKMTLIKDKENKYIQYRFGTKKQVEMEFPKERTKKSWSYFQYNSYWRGGGKENSGEEIDNLLFKNNGYEYLIYRTYFAENEKYSAGIIVTNVKGKYSRIIGNYKTVIGCICNLEDTGMIKKAEIGLEF